MWLSLSAVCARQAGIVSVLQPGSLAQCTQCVGQAGTERVNPAWHVVRPHSVELWTQNWKGPKLKFMMYFVSVCVCMCVCGYVCVYTHAVGLYTCACVRLECPCWPYSKRYKLTKGILLKCFGGLYTWEVCVHVNMQEEIHSTSYMTSEMDT